MSAGGAAGSVLVLFFGSLLCAFILYRYTKKHPQCLRYKLGENRFMFWRKLRGEPIPALHYLLAQRGGIGGIEVGGMEGDNVPLVSDSKKWNTVDEFLESCFVVANSNFAYFQIVMFVVATLQLILCGIIAPGVVAVTLYALVWVLRALACVMVVQPQFAVCRVSRLYGVSNAISMFAVIFAIIDYSNSDIDNLGALITFLLCVGMSKLFWLWTTISVEGQNVKYVNMFISIAAYSVSWSASTIQIPIAEFVENHPSSPPAGSYVPPAFVPPGSHLSSPPPYYDPQQPQHYPHNSAIMQSYSVDPRYSHVPQASDPRYSQAPQSPQHTMDPRYSQAPYSPQDPRYSHAPQSPQHNDPRYSQAPQNTTTPNGTTPYPPGDHRYSYPPHNIDPRFSAYYAPPLDRTPPPSRPTSYAPGAHVPPDDSATVTTTAISAEPTSPNPFDEQPQETKTNPFD